MADGSTPWPPALHELERRAALGGVRFGPPNTSTSGSASAENGQPGTADRVAPSRRRRGTTASSPAHRRAGRCGPRRMCARQRVQIRTVGKAISDHVRDVGVAVGADERLEPRRIDLCLQARQAGVQQGYASPRDDADRHERRGIHALRSHAPAVPPRRPSPPLGGCFGGTVTFAHRPIGAAGRPTGVRCDTRTSSAGRRWGGPVGKLDMARRAVGMARGLRLCHATPSPFPRPRPW